MRKICFSIMAFNIRYSLLDKNIFRFYLNFFIKIFYKPNHIAGSIILGASLGIFVRDPANTHYTPASELIYNSERENFIAANLQYGQPNRLKHKFILPTNHARDYDGINIFNLRQPGLNGQNFHRTVDFFYNQEIFPRS